MCNPNGLYYQQMVNSLNAYWLQFFLKRECNVLCWNYRGYGESTQSCTDFADPMKAKMDAERVFAGMIQKLQLKGKIGVYGRSIGGITACHLAGKFKDIVELLVIDRSLSELSEVMVSKFKGKSIEMIFNFATNGWVCNNIPNFIENNNCYKIITCDPTDDTVDLFSSVPLGIAKTLGVK